VKTYKVLTIRQPWASLIVWGVKPVENRSWITNHRGALLIHAGMKYERDPELERKYQFGPDDLDYGAVIGIVELADIVEQHRSPFFKGPFGWVLRNARGIDPIPMKGKLGLFNARLDLTRRRIHTYA
jgi:hypothetical protein